MKNKNIFKFFKCFFPIFCIISIYIIGINYYVIGSQDENVYTSESISDIKNVDYIMILGCGIWGDEPSPMLKDRLLEGINISNKYKDAYIIVSGDNSGEDHNEIKVMKNFLMKNGVKEEKILEDNIGFSTYESVYNLKYTFKAQNPIIITQDFHIHRAVYIAKSMNLNAIGIASTPINFTYLPYSSFREIFARNKDFIKCIFDKI